MLFQKEGRDVHRFVHRGNKVGQTIANDEGQDVVNKVGRVLEAGVRGERVSEEEREKTWFERKQLVLRRKSLTGKNDPASGMKEDDVVLPAFSFISHEAKQFEKLREAFGLSEGSI